MAYPKFVCSPDRCSLVDPAQVERTQDVLLQCLHYLLRKNHADDRLCLARIVDMLVQLRHVRYLQLQVSIYLSIYMGQLLWLRNIA